MEDATGFYTGQVAYLFSGGLKSASSTGYTTGSEVAAALSSGSLSQFQPAHYDDSTNNVHFPVLYGNSSVYYNTTDSDVVTSITSTGTAFLTTASDLPNTTSLSNAYILAATCWQTTFYVMASANGSAYLIQATTSTPNSMSGGTIAVAKASGSTSPDLSEGWVTARGAVLHSHSDNSSILYAFDWTGKQKGTFRVASDSNNVVFAFHPNGQYWFAYDPANGRVTKYKAWW
jgi:hypothetical protein